MNQVRCIAARHAPTAHLARPARLRFDATCRATAIPRWCIAALVAFALAGSATQATVSASPFDDADKNAEASPVRISRPLAIDPRTPVHERARDAETPSPADDEADESAANDTAHSDAAPADTLITDDGVRNPDAWTDAAVEPAPSDDEPAYEPPARERLPLGQPQTSAFLAGDADADATGATDDGTTSPLGRLDPRQNKITRALLSLLAVIAVIFLMRPILARVARTFGLSGTLLGRARRPAGVLEILARYPIGRGQQLMLLKLDRRVVLLHHAGQQMTPLCEVSEPSQVASLLARIEAGSRGGSEEVFEQALQRMSRQYESPRSAGIASAASERVSASPSARSGRSSSTADLPPGLAHFDRSDIETIDLTRSQGGGWRALLGPFGRSGRAG